MRQLVIFLCSILFIAACSSKNKVPKDILPKQQMEDVLWDLLRGGEFLEIYRLPKDTSIDKAAIAQKWYDEIFRLHKIDRSVFEKSYTWYKEHPVVMKEVLDSITSKQVPDNRPPGQSTTDSATLKRDSTSRMDSALRSQDSVRRSQDSLKRPLIRTGRRPDDTFAIKKDNIRTRNDSSANFFLLPGQKIKKLQMDSIRRARAKKLPD
jgi:hypothetical protein